MNEKNSVVQDLDSVNQSQNLATAPECRLSYQTQGLLELLREHGPYGLGGNDGCRCCHFSNYNISVDLSCHKSNGGAKWHRWGVLRVSSGSFGVGMDDYKAIAEELLRQLREPSWEEEYEDEYWLVRFCGWKYDDKQLCVYCSKPREEQRGYLCSKCLQRDSPMGGKVADEYDYRRIMVNEPAQEVGTTTTG